MGDPAQMGFRGREKYAEEEGGEKEPLTGRREGWGVDVDGQMCLGDQGYPPLNSFVLFPSFPLPSTFKR
jgi:hypothetical protein